jgi:S-adenosylmethionine-dependent methyltransferase
MVCLPTSLSRSDVVADRDAAIALASRGHRVTLSDLSGKSLDIARRNAEKGTVQLDAIIHANALDIAQHSLLISSIGTFDMVLCLGPLYHLVVSEERASVIRNCISMAKPGGYILLAYVTVYAHLRNLAKRDPSRLANEWSFYEEYMNSGKYTRNPETRSFHIHHAKLQQELFAFGGQVTLEKVLSCEGFLGSSGGIGLATLSETDMKRWIDVVMRTADHTETLNSADHLLVILRRVNTCRAS